MGHRMLPIVKISATDSRCHGNEIWDKKLAITRLVLRNVCEIFAPIKRFSLVGHRMLPIAFSATDHRCHDNEIRNKIGYKSACVRDICEIFCICVGVFGNGTSNDQMLLTEFYPDQPLLPWQQNLRQNRLYIDLYNKYHQDSCI